VGHFLLVKAFHVYLGEMRAQLRFRQRIYGQFVEVRLRLLHSQPLFPAWAPMGQARQGARQRRKDKSTPSSGALCHVRIFTRDTDNAQDAPGDTASSSSSSSEMSPVIVTTCM
jgi:hypothetical protein